MRLATSAVCCATHATWRAKATRQPQRRGLRNASTTCAETWSDLVNQRERDELLEWVQLHRCCAVCWWPESDGRRSLEVHHLVGGRGRKHDVRQYLRLCDRCHGVYHSGKVIGLFPDLTHGILLSTKQESDPDNYDPSFLASLRMKKHLGYDPEPVPEFYLEERQRNTGRWRTP